MFYLKSINVIRKGSKDRGNYIIRGSDVIQRKCTE